MKKTILRVLGFALVLALTLTCFGCSSGSAGDKELVIFSWEGYIDPELLTDFTEQTGIKINYNYFNSEEEMLAKLEAVKGGDYDIIIASDYIINIARARACSRKSTRKRFPTIRT